MLQVELVGRLMAAFASRGQGASRKAEAVALLTTGMGSQQLLAEGRLAEYHGCLACVLEAVPKLPPTAVGRLLACFDLGGFSAALLHRGTPDTGHDQVRSPANHRSPMSAAMGSIYRAHYRPYCDFEGMT